MPRSLIGLDRLAPYCIGDLVSTSVHGDHVILDINFYEIEAGDWIEGEGWLSSLAQLRRDLLRGDFRALYLIWLKAALLEVDYEIEVDALEPPVPAGLGDLSAPLRAFVDFFDIDADQRAGQHPRGAARAGCAPEGAPSFRRADPAYHRAIQQPACPAAALEEGGSPARQLLMDRRVRTEAVRKGRLGLRTTCFLLCAPHAGKPHTPLRILIAHNANGQC